jgi:hypothetical protein
MATFRDSLHFVIAGKEEKNVRIGCVATIEDV